MKDTYRGKALLIRNAFFRDFGGGEKFPVHLAIELQQNGVKAIIVTRSQKSLNYARDHHLRTVRGWWWSRQGWSGRGALLFPAYVFWQLLLTLWYAQLILRIQPTVIHPQSKDDFIAATIAGRLFGKRVIWTDHADLKYVFANHTRRLKNPVGKLVYLASGLAHAITLVSHSEKQLIEAALGRPLPQKYTVIHNGVSDTPVQPIKKSMSEQEAVIFCSTSRLVEAKGIGELLSAFSQVHRANPQAILWIIGDGPDAARYKELAADVSGVMFLGHIDQPLPHLAAADIFVHPSHHEGFSLSLVEAAMLSKPIIACDTGGNPEIIKHAHTGLLVPVKDTDALAKAMLLLAGDKATRTRLGEGARALYEAEYNFNKIVKDRFLPLYEA